MIYMIYNRTLKNDIALYMKVYLLLRIYKIGDIVNLRFILRIPM